MQDQSAASPASVVWRTISRFRRDDLGATAPEYALLTALIGMGILAAIKTLSGDLSGVFNKLTTTLAGM